ncbi:MAG TPA: nitronate monooxygenase [Gemmatimonadaceae bacterium]|nr:nitronate monooxygenase [Gemmatimonadaceae bacterium]
MTSLTVQDLLGVALPIVQAPMAGAQASALAIAVSNAGGLGSLPCALLDLDTMRAELARIRAHTTRPYNVNFFCHTPPAPDPARDAAWRTALVPYYRELGLDPNEVPAGPTRSPFSNAAADIVEEFRPPIVSFHFGLPSPELVARVRAWGAKILACATTVDEARWLEAHGVDAIIAQGLEAGGHRGNFLTADMTTQLGTFALIPQVVAAVRVPVIAAGGIADARGVSAALRLGAVGAQVGTTYLLCPEVTISPVYRAALRSPDASHTALTNLISGRPARGIVNRLMRELGPMSDLPPAFPLATPAVAPLRAAAEAKGMGDFSPLWAGQNTSGCKEIPAAELTRELAADLK